MLVHGVQAAATMDQLRSAVRALAPIVPPAALLEQLDVFANDPAVSGAFGASVAIILVDTETNLATVAIAGHPPPLMRTPDGNVQWLDAPHGALLGVSNAPRTEFTIAAPARSTFFLYTDGLVERRREDLGERLDLVAQTMRSCSDSPHECCESILGQLLTGHQSDDVAVLCVRVNEA